MKIIPQIDTYPRLVTFCATPCGRVALLGTFAAALWIDRVRPWPELTVLAGVLSFLPKYRPILVSLAALYWLFVHNDWIYWDFVQRMAAAEGQRRDWVLYLWAGSLLTAIFCGVALFFRYVRGRGGSFLARRPVLALVSGYVAILVAAGILPLHGATRTLLWTFIALLAPYLWFFAYALQDAASKTADTFTLQLGTFHPFYMATFQSFNPIGKGRAYLRKTAARTTKDLSVVQLKAVKLLLWIAVLERLQQLLLVILHGAAWRPVQALSDYAGWRVPSLGVPTLEAALQQTIAGARLPTHLAWASVIAHFVESLLGLYVSGNLVVACCRMAGFYILRNTYRPLQAQTIAEFWNRYYYYFKELLVEFFFFPTYMRYFKKYRRLRTFAATIAAATLGNMTYHFCRDFVYVADMGLSAAVSGFQVYAFYTLLLGLGIGISQLRSHQAGPVRALPWGRRLLASVIVMTFFCLLEVFDYEPRSHNLGAHLAFFLNLFSFGG